MVPNLGGGGAGSITALYKADFTVKERILRTWGAGVEASDTKNKGKGQRLHQTFLFLKNVDNECLLFQKRT